MTKTVKASASAKKAEKGLRPIQYGLGNKSGIDKMNHALDAANERGQVLLKDDAKNAFNAIARLSIREAMQSKWAEAVPFFDTFYGVRAPIFFMHKDNDDRQIIKVIWSTEGTRQGCVLGSLCFDIGIARHLYEPMQAAYPDVDHAALTDDLIKIWTPPAIDAPSAEWEAFYDRISEYIAEFRALALPHGIVMVDEKSALLIPANAPLPASMTRSNGGSLS